MGTGFAAIETDLELDEYVIAMRSQGLVGVIATNHRILGVHAHSTTFAELRYRINEKPVDPSGVYVADRLALVNLRTRLAGFSPKLGTWVELALGPGENPREIDAQGGVAAVVTPRRAIGFSSRSPQFAEINLSPDEDVESASFGDASVTLILPHKILIFRAGDGFWSTLLRNMN